VFVFFQFILTVLVLLAKGCGWRNLLFVIELSIFLLAVAVVFVVGILLVVANTFEPSGWNVTAFEMRGLVSWNLALFSAAFFAINSEKSLEVRGSRSCCVVC